MFKKQARQQPFSTEEFKTIYSQVPRLTVDILLAIESGIVLIKRQEKSWQGQWHVPGGTVFYREKIANAIVRVGKEELGIEVSPIKLTKVVEYFDEVAERGFGYSVGLAHICVPTQPITPEILDIWASKQIQVFQTIPPNTIKLQQPMILEALELIQVA